MGINSELVINTPTLGVSANGSPIWGFVPTSICVFPILTRAEPSAFSITPVSRQMSLYSSNDRLSDLSPLFTRLVKLSFIISGIIITILLTVPLDYGIFLCFG